MQISVGPDDRYLHELSFGRNSCLKLTKTNALVSSNRDGTPCDSNVIYPLFSASEPR